MNVKLTSENLALLRCSNCGSMLNQEQTGLICEKCGERYAINDLGVPLLGKFGHADLHNLMEMVTTHKRYLVDKKNGFSQYENMFLAYDHDPSEENMKQAGMFPIPAWFVTRYKEWKIWRLFLGTKNLKNKRILIVGAGDGFEATHFHHFEPQITALENDPFKARRGQLNLPDTFWVQGFAHNLPFPDESFDYIICNKALHHMADVPKAIEEFLRVVKVGGEVLTISDSFLIKENKDTQLKIFNHHAAVLNGVNENCPVLETFLQPLKKHRTSISGDFYFESVSARDELGLACSGIRSVPINAMLDAPLTTFMTFTQFDNGGLSLKIRKNRPLALKSKPIPPPNIGSRQKSLQKMSPKMVPYAFC